MGEGNFLRELVNLGFEARYLSGVREYLPEQQGDYHEIDEIACRHKAKILGKAHHESGEQCHDDEDGGKDHPEDSVLDENLVLLDLLANHG